ncbi:MAG: hypothetical protein ACOYM8_18190, partial [Caulobacterales bacterium]
MAIVVPGSENRNQQAPMTTRFGSNRRHSAPGNGRKPGYRFIAAILGLLFAWSYFLAPVAVAEPIAPTVISPLKVVSDRNSVNISTGLARVGVPSISIPAAPRLKFDLVQN